MLYLNEPPMSTRRDRISDPAFLAQLVFLEARLAGGPLSIRSTLLNHTSGLRLPFSSESLSG